MIFYMDSGGLTLCTSNGSFFWVHLVPKKALSDRGDGEDVSNPVVYVKTAKEAAMAAQAWKLTAAAEATRLPPGPF